MLYPSINDLLKNVDSRYTLVLLVSKRARQIVDGAEPLVEPKSNKPVSIAVQEVSENKVTYTRPQANK
ncbi:DNA-directed RNA polymerase subunit omega [Proteiniborus sp. DW1]|uniref:DNA-directed RNA polymerase subunit omega n=1 Tax=Proteiniborus sp. DW1 TaxID=1889883 RepID=UPI00092DFB61|nr:DNA-directed RNA polymerase subunit omega [Proteiniborus sp. DW1]SCG83514.1 DNA-directed RNA polymerase subunit omega [Proteiniborus sp. DW1]